jgi:hypothetical protein
VQGDCGKSRRPRRPEALEAGKLELDGDAGGRDGVDQRAAVPDDPPHPRPERGGMRIEAEHDLRLARGHGRREGVAEAPDQRSLTALFSPLPAVKRGMRVAAI